MRKKPPYFESFQGETPPKFRGLTEWERGVWQVFSGATIGFGLWYLAWRWTASLNPDALVFSITVAVCETVAFIGTALFFFDIWDEDDTPMQPSPKERAAVGLNGKGAINVDIFITTFDEDLEVIAPSVKAAILVATGPQISSEVFLLDDGDRLEMRNLAREYGVGYLSRQGNRGFKAGNLANAMFQTSGDFVVVCDADTQLFPTFLDHTLGYFRDPKVSWVQTPHWFYDIPKGEKWSDLFSKKEALWARYLGLAFAKITGEARSGNDLFLSNPELFFDVIQRRRNRNAASFCCGAGSIHRREAVFDNALCELGLNLEETSRGWKGVNATAILPRLDLQPFRYHVSEDIFTSIQQHQKGWKSVYHPQVEARMLSPWSVSAWAMQKLKYAGGTFDIMLNANPLFRAGMPWQIKLHYLATFWSYLAILWLPILILSPAYSLMTGKAPVASFSAEFFAHILPVLIANEIALNATSKGQSITAGRMLSVGTLFIQWRAFVQVLRGRKPHFPPTPKTPVLSISIRHALPNLIILALLVASLGYGAFRFFSNDGAYSTAFFVVNGFWILWTSIALCRVTKCALVKPRLPGIT